MSILPLKDPFISITRFKDWMYTPDIVLLPSFLMKPLRTDEGENWNETQRTWIVFVELDCFIWFIISCQFFVSTVALQKFMTLLVFYKPS